MRDPELDASAAQLCSEGTSPFKTSHHLALKSITYPQKNNLLIPKALLMPTNRASHFSKDILGPLAQPRGTRCEALRASLRPLMLRAEL